MSQPVTPLPAPVALPWLGAAVVVAAGCSGTGRSSLANVSIHEWTRLRALRPERVVVVPWTVQNFDALDQMWRWSLKIKSCTMKAGLTLQPSTESELASLRSARPAALGAALSDVLQMVEVDLRQGIKFHNACAAKKVENRTAIAAASSALAVIR